MLILTRKKPYVIGIAGGSGAGKTFIIDKIKHHMKNCDVVCLQHDWYYKHNPHLSSLERDTINYDHPNALETDLLAAHIEKLSAGHPIQAPQYDFNTHLRKPDPISIQPAQLIIIDGILIFTHKPLRQLIDLKIYVDTEPDIRFTRRMERDIKTRGRTRKTVKNQYLQTVKPMHDMFVEPSKQYADIVISNNYFNETNFLYLVKEIRQIFF